MRYQQRLAPVQSVPNTEASALASQAESLLSFGRQALDVAGREIVRIGAQDAERKGQEAGLKAATQLSKGEPVTAEESQLNTIAAQHFNDAMRGSFTAGVKQDYITRLNELETDYPTDTEGFDRQVKALTEGLSSSIPDGMKPELDFYFDQHRRTVLDNIREKQRDKSIKDAEASQTALGSTAYDRAFTSAQNGDLASAELAMEDYRLSLDQRVSIGTITAEQRDAAITKANQTLRNSAVLSDTLQTFNDELRAGRGRVFLDEFQEDDANTEKYGGPAGKLKVYNTLYAQMTRHESLSRANTEAADGVVKWAVKQMDEGYNPDSQLVEQALSELPIDSPQRQQYNAAKANKPYMDAFRDSIPEAQDAAIDAVEAQLRAGETEPGQTEQLARMKKVRDDTKTALKDDPYSFGIRNGIIPPQKPLINADGAIDPQAFMERSSAQEKLSSFYKMDVSIMTDGEADLMGRTLMALPPKDRAIAITALDKTVPEKTTLAVLKKLNGVDPLLPAAAIAIMRHRKTVDGADLGMTIMVGQEALNPPDIDGKKQTPRLVLEDRGTTGASAKFNRYVGNAFAGNSQAYEQAKSAVNATYAGMAVQAGDYSKKPNGDLYEKALKSYFGGIVQWRGSQVIPPFGMDKGDFKDTAEYLMRQEATAAGFDRVRVEAISRRAVPRNSGDGTYRLMLDGEYLPDPRKRNPDGTFQDLQINMRGLSAPVNPPQPKVEAPGKPQEAPQAVPKPAATLDTIPIESRRKLPYNAPELDAYATRMEQKYKLPAGILNALKNAGEKSQSHEVSKAGARGVMQFMPENLAKYGVRDPTDPVQMIEAAAKYLNDTKGQYNGNINAMIADYNGGPRQAKPVINGKQPPASETRNYLIRVQRYLADRDKRPSITATAGVRG